MVGVTMSGAGPDLVLVPGSPQPAEDLAPLARRLSSSFRVWLVSPPGWDGTRACAPYSLDAAADTIAASLQGLGSAVWVGCSFGFWRAVHLLGTHRVAPARALVGLAPVVGFDAAAREAFRGAAGAVAAGVDIGEVLVQRFLSPAFAAAHPASVARVARFCHVAPAEVIAAELLAVAEAQDVGPLLATLTAPLYVRVGALDVAVPPEAARAVAAWAPRSVVDVVPGAGHLLGHEDLEGTAAAIEGWARSA